MILEPYMIPEPCEPQPPLSERLAANRKALDALTARCAIPRDVWGLTEKDHAEIARGCEAHQRLQRWKALKVLWGKPDLKEIRYDGVPIYRANRDEMFTIWRAVRVTVAVLLDRRAGGMKYLQQDDMCFWGSGPCGYGWSATVLALCPGTTYIIYDDGD